MLSIDGYTPLNDLYRKCLLHIFRPYYKWEKTHVDEEVSPSNQRFSAENISGAAQYLALSIIHERWRKVMLLSPILSLIELPSRHLLPDYYECSKRTFKVENVAEKLSFYQGDAWQEHFAREQVFKKWRSWPLPENIIDWNYGTVDLSPIKNRLVLSAEPTQTTEIDAALVNNAVANPDDVLGAQIQAVMKTLLPYDGYPIVIPDGWQAIFSNSKESITPQSDEMRPWERILEIAYQDPSLKKNDIKQRLYPKASARAFTSWFNVAAVELPRLSRPGRRPRDDKS